MSSTLKAVPVRSASLKPEAADAVSLNISLIDSICDALRSVDVQELKKGTLCNLMYLQQEKLEDIRRLLQADEGREG